MTDDCTCANCNAKRNRIAAFGAIRRAAAVARENDLRYDFDVSDEIRYAIRAAIGSPKA